MESAHKPAPVDDMMVADISGPPCIAHNMHRIAAVGSLRVLRLVAPTPLSTIAPEAAPMPVPRPPDRGTKSRRDTAAEAIMVFEPRPSDGDGMD